MDKLLKGDRVLCDLILDAFINCDIHRRDGSIHHLGKLKIVSIPDSNASYIDAKSVRSDLPKVVYNIGMDQECRLVPWRKSNLKMLSCFHKK